MQEQKLRENGILFTTLKAKCSEGQGLVNSRHET
jgi:hypothetical protein